MESYYRLQYEILRLIDDGKISEAQQYLWKKVHQQDTDALAIIGFLYFYGVGLKKDEQKGKKMKIFICFLNDVIIAHLHLHFN